MFARIAVFAGAALCAAAGSGHAQTIEDSANCTNVINSMLELPGNAAIKRAEEIGIYGSRIVRVLNRYHALKREPEIMQDEASGVRDKLGMHCQAHPNETILDAVLGAYANAELAQATFGSK